eukprot:scaffold151379_cov33-Tisochrysis_lutea.AAC.5
MERHEAGIIARVDIGTKMNEQHTRGSQANACHKVETCPAVWVTEVGVGAIKERLEKQRAVGGLRRLKQAFVLR